MLESNIFVFKQRTAYEMRISDWSSDVCSSDLFHAGQELASVSQAPEGHFTDGTLVLDNVTQTNIDAGSVSALAVATKPDAPLTHIDTQSKRVLQTSLTPERLIARILTPERMSILDLVGYNSRSEEHTSKLQS